jgi:hypothetical protein
MLKLDIDSSPPASRLFLFIVPQPEKKRKSRRPFLLPLPEVRKYDIIRIRKGGPPPKKEKEKKA